MRINKAAMGEAEVVLTFDELQLLKNALEKSEAYMDKAEAHTLLFQIEQLMADPLLTQERLP